MSQTVNTAELNIFYRSRGMWQGTDAFSIIRTRVRVSLPACHQFESLNSSVLVLSVLPVPPQVMSRSIC